MELTITKVIKRTEGKDGKPFISKTGKPYARASIQTVEYGQEWLGGFWRSDLVEGAKIEAEVKEREYNGKTYRDFELPKREQIAANVSADLGKIKTELTTIKMLLLDIKASVEPKKAKYPTAEDEGIDTDRAGEDTSADEEEWIASGQ